MRLFIGLIAIAFSYAAHSQGNTNIKYSEKGKGGPGYVRLLEAGNGEGSLVFFGKLRNEFALYRYDAAGERIAETKDIKLGRNGRVAKIIVDSDSVSVFYFDILGAKGGIATRYKEIAGELRVKRWHKKTLEERQGETPSFGVADLKYLPTSMGVCAIETSPSGNYTAVLLNQNIPTKKGGDTPLKYTLVDKNFKVVVQEELPGTDVTTTMLHLLLDCEGTSSVVVMNMTGGMPKGYQIEKDGNKEDLDMQELAASMSDPMSLFGDCSDLYNHGENGDFRDPSSDVVGARMTSRFFEMFKYSGISYLFTVMTDKDGKNAVATSTSNPLQPSDITISKTGPMGMEKLTSIPWKQSTKVTVTSSSINSATGATTSSNTTDATMDYRELHGGVVALKDGDVIHMLFRDAKANYDESGLYKGGDDPQMHQLTSSGHIVYVKIDLAGEEVVERRVLDASDDAEFVRLSSSYVDRAGNIHLPWSNGLKYRTVTVSLSELAEGK